MAHHAAAVHPSRLILKDSVILKVLPELQVLNHSMGPKQHRYTVYILGSITGTLYIGVTNNLGVRIRQHKNHAFAGFTAHYEVTRLLYYEVYEHIGRAIGREKQLKGWRREKKIALIETMNPQWKDLSKEWDEMRLRTKAVETFK